MKKIIILVSSQGVGSVIGERGHATS